jgi:mannose-6-phosphate isomerase
MVCRMKKIEPYPLLFAPLYQDYLWGGGRIPALFGRPPRRGTSAESWEIADRSEGMSVVRNGPLARRSLRRLVKSMGADLLGTRAAGRSFPLLIKIIDAGQRLSLQVHPNGRTASRHSGEPKTEMWYVLRANRGAHVFAGLKPGTTRRKFSAALARGRVEKLLKKVPIRPGMAVFVPGGRVHAIGEGCLLLEVQQNSNTTYRVDDWNRVDARGNPRELHVAQALDTIDWRDNASPVVGPAGLPCFGRNRHWQVLRCPLFDVRRLELAENEPCRNSGDSFRILFAVKGRVRVRSGRRSATLRPGTSCLLPACLTTYSLKPLGRKAEILQISAGQSS